MKAATAVLRVAAIPVATVMILISNPAVSRGQTSPVPQALPYAQDFISLPHASTAYPAGWQGWTNGTVGAVFLTTGPTADQAMVASGTAALGTGAIYNYNGKFGPLNSGSVDFGLGLAINTIGASGVVVRYEVGTMRNPYNGGANTRINEIALQYRVGSSGAWTTLAGTAYQNNTALQIGNTTTPQNPAYRTVTLPAACDQQPVVELRWAQRQVSGAGARPSFAVDNVAIAQSVAGGQATGLAFDGVDDYVTFGQAPALGATNFTIETWFKRTGPGTSTNTGAGGINVIPLVAKGFAENDGSVVDMNYILGIRPFAGPVIGIDFEEGTGQTIPGQNHPLWGTTVIQDNVWYHAAATHDGTTLRIYLNGALEATLVLGADRLPQSASIQHASLGTALGTNGGIPAGETQGLFHGVLDEARIWSVAHSECEISASMNQEVTSGDGLLGRWGMSEGEGLELASSLGVPRGILMNGPTWVAGSPFDVVSPATPTIEASAGTGGSITPSGSILVTCGTNQGFTIEAAACYTLADVVVDGVSAGAVGFYTFTNVQANHTIAASFTLNGPFAVEASAGAGGSITPSGSTMVACGADQGYTITADPCYAIADVLIDGSSVGAVASFSFGNVQANHTIAASFTLSGPFAVEASAGPGGSVTPNGSSIVACGADLSYTISASPCYVIADVLVDGASVGAVTGHTFTNVQSNHTIAATFTVTTFAIDASAGTGGEITPSGNTIVDCGSDQMFTITPAPCYTIADVLVDGLSVGPVGFYTFSAIDAGHTITASFALSGPFTIEASAGAGGSITPTGSTIIACGGSQSYAIDADDCFAIVDVLVDGTSIGAVAAFTFNNVQQSHTIAVTFAAMQSTITAQAIGFGVISPAGSSVVGCGGNVTYTITPDPGFVIANVIVDGQGVGTSPSYAFTNVVTDHSITAVFGQTTAVEELPREFALSRIWPNPVRERTAIEFTVASASHVRLSVLDVAGHEVHVLAEGPFAPGRHSVSWDGRTARGAVAPGIYFVSYMKPGGRQVRKLVMTR